MLRLHGWRGAYQEVEERIPVGTDGSAIGDVASGICDLGLAVRCVAVPPEKLIELPLPAIAFLELPGKWRHFVVVSAIDDFNVRILDPATMQAASMRRDQYNQLNAGYFVIVRRWQSSARYLAAVVVFFLAVVGGVSFLRTRWLKKTRVIASILAVLLAVTCNGCRRPSDSAHVLEVPVTSYTKDVLDANEVVKYSFAFRNSSTREVSVRLGSPSCGCLSAELLPSDGAVAPGSSGAVNLTLRPTDDTHAGLFDAKVGLAVQETGEFFALSLSGAREGVGTDGFPYVIRPTNLKKRIFPPMKFLIYTREADTLFEILSISTQLSEQHDPKEPGRNSDSQLPQVNANWAAAVIGPAAAASLGDVIFYREIRVPVSASGDCKNSVAGCFIVRYKIRNGTVREGRVPVMVITENSSF
jgi:hypothetical protein